MNKNTKRRLGKLHDEIVRQRKERERIAAPEKLAKEHPEQDVTLTEKPAAPVDMKERIYGK